MLLTLSFAGSVWVLVWCHPRINYSRCNQYTMLQVCWNIQKAAKAWVKGQQKQNRRAVQGRHNLNYTLLHLKSSIYFTWTILPETCRERNQWKTLRRMENQFLNCVNLKSDLCCKICDKEAKSRYYSLLLLEWFYR